MKQEGMFSKTVQEMERLRLAIDSTPLWKDGQELLAEIDWCIERTKELRKEASRKLIVTLVGPSGSW